MVKNYSIIELFHCLERLEIFMSLNYIKNMKGEKMKLRFFNDSYNVVINNGLICNHPELLEILIS
jgi:hypothetical protein